MFLKILAFGISKEIIGKPSFEIKVNKSITVSDLKKILIKNYPKLGDISNFFIAVNTSYAKNNIKIKSSDEIAIIPPTNGG